MYDRLLWRRLGGFGAVIGRGSSCSGGIVNDRVAGAELERRRLQFLRANQRRPETVERPYSHGSGESTSRKGAAALVNTAMTTHKNVLRILGIEDHAIVVVATWKYR